MRSRSRSRPTSSGTTREQELLAAARQEAAAIREKARADGQKIVDEARARAEAENERVPPQDASS